MSLSSSFFFTLLMPLCVLYMCMEFFSHIWPILKISGFRINLNIIPERTWKVVSKKWINWIMSDFSLLSTIKYIRTQTDSIFQYLEFKTWPKSAKNWVRYKQLLWSCGVLLPCYTMQTSKCYSTLSALRTSTRWRSNLISALIGGQS